MTLELTDSEANERRRQVLQAARWCFLNFGYAKTSLEDIARRAHLSRTLLYRMFKNKEDIFRGVFDDWFVDRYPAVDQIVAGKGPRKDRLLRICELLLLEPWDEMVGAPMALEFYEVCARVAPASEEKQRKVALKAVQRVLGDKEAAEVFLMSLEGLHGDLPSTKALRRRVEILIERFVA